MSAERWHGLSNIMPIGTCVALTGAVVGCACQVLGDEHGVIAGLAIACSGAAIMLLAAVADCAADVVDWKNGIAHYN